MVLNLRIALCILSLLFMLNNGLASNQVTLYDNLNFGGQTSRSFSGDTPWVGSDINDKTSSLRVPDGKWVILYADTNYKGKAEVFTGDTSWVGTGFNDIASSLRVVDSGKVTLWEDTNFKGKPKEFNGNTPWVGTDINDKASSLRIPAGKAIMAFEHSNYNGRARIFTGDTSWIGSDFNDIISSFKFIDLREGDIIYGEKDWPHHVGIIVNDGGRLVVREAWPRNKEHASEGVSNIDVSDFSGHRPNHDNYWPANGGYYNEIRIYRVDVDDQTAHQAAEKAKTMSGTYQANFLEFRRPSYWSDDDDEWYCSKLVWKAYADVGIYLKPLNSKGQIEVPVTPNEIAYSSRTTRLYTYNP